MSRRPISPEAVERAAELASRNGGGTSEQEHRAMAEEARRIERVASEGGSKERERAPVEKQRIEATTKIRHD